MCSIHWREMSGTQSLWTSFQKSWVGYLAPPSCAVKKSVIITKTLPSFHLLVYWYFLPPYGQWTGRTSPSAWFSHLNCFCGKRKWAWLDVKFLLPCPILLTLPPFLLPHIWWWNGKPNFPILGSYSVENLWDACLEQSSMQGTTQALHSAGLSDLLGKHPLSLRKLGIYTVRFPNYKTSTICLSYPLCIYAETRNRWQMSLCILMYTHRDTDTNYTFYTVSSRLNWCSITELHTSSAL